MTINYELKIKEMALFNFLSMKHEKNKRIIRELSVKDVIVMKFLTA